MHAQPHILLVELKDIFADYFTPASLSELAFELGIDIDNIRGATHRLKSQNLAIALWQQGKLPQLATIGPKHNASIDWAGLLARHGIPVPAPLPDPAQPPIQGESPMPIDPVSATIIVAALPPLFEWFRPGVQKVADAFGDVLQRRIYTRFKEQAAAIPPGSPSAQAQYEAVARTVVQEASPGDVIEMERGIKRAAIQVIRDPQVFSRPDLIQLWQDYRRDTNTEAFDDMWARKGHMQAAAAEEIVMEAIRAGKFAMLLRNEVLPKHAP